MQRRYVLLSLVMASGMVRAMEEEKKTVVLPSEKSDILGRIHTAASRGSTNTVKSQIECKVDKNDLSLQKRTPLFYAALNNRTATMQYLLDQKVLVNHLDAAGNTALHMAASKNHKDAVELLLKYGANPNLKNLNGQKPGRLARECGHADLGALLKGREHTWTTWTLSWLVAPVTYWFKTP